MRGLRLAIERRWDEEKISRGKIGEDVCDVDVSFYNFLCPILKNGKQPKKYTVNIQVPRPSSSQVQVTGTDLECYEDRSSLMIVKLLLYSPGTYQKQPKKA